MPWPTLREQRRPRRRVRLIELTEEERQDLLAPMGKYVLCETCYLVPATTGCSHNEEIWHGIFDACGIYMCRQHAYWLDGRPYCARHAGERR